MAARKQQVAKPMPFNEADLVAYMKGNAIVLTTGPITDDFAASMAAKMTAKAKPAKAHVEYAKSLLEALQTEAEKLKPVEGAVLVSTDAGLLHVEHSDEPNEAEETEAEDGEEGEGKRASIVPVKFREEYKRRGDATNCGDHVAKFLKRATLDSKGGSRVDILKDILSQNGVNYGRWVGQIDDNKMGQFRMNSGNELRRVIAREGFFFVPASVFTFLDAVPVKYNDVVDGLFVFDDQGNARLTLDDDFRAKWMTAKDKKAMAEESKLMAAVRADLEATSQE